MEGFCSIDGCGMKAFCRGWCKKHYERIRRHGNTDALKHRTQDTAERLALCSERDEATGCLNWVRTINKTRGGYGVVAFGGGTYRLAHRVAWELAYGPIPKGLMVCHSCDNPRCIEITHLFLGGAAVNNKDMRIKGRNRGRPRSLSPAIVREILARAAAGEAQNSIAAALGISQPRVSHIVTGRSYKQV